MNNLRLVTDRFYPGMFYPSTLIILMNEVKMGRYSVKPHKMSLDLSGEYKTLTIRSDIGDWLRENYKTLIDSYRKLYPIRSYVVFVNYFLWNLFESKLDAQDNVIRIDESDFQWLWKEYSSRAGADMPFGRFADSYVNELLSKMRAARKILS